MPDENNLPIGSARQMEAAILFFDLENYTYHSSRITPEQALNLLNMVTPTMVRIVRLWNGEIEKHTGDGIMAIIGTETSDTVSIANDAIEVAQTMRYIMNEDVRPLLIESRIPPLQFRIGVDMGQILISRLGIHSYNFLTAVGDVPNRASRLQEIAEPGGICIGQNLAFNIDKYYQQFLRTGTDPSWDWVHSDMVTPYPYFHYDFTWSEPKEWRRALQKGIMKRGLGRQPRAYPLENAAHSAREQYQQW